MLSDTVVRERERDRRERREKGVEESHEVQAYNEIMISLIIQRQVFTPEKKMF